MICLPAPLRRPLWTISSWLFLSISLIFLHNFQGLDEDKEEESSAYHTSSLIISEFVGCSPSMSGAIRVNPWSIDDVADGIYTAITMTTEGRPQMTQYRVRDQQVWIVWWRFGRNCRSLWRCTAKITFHSILIRIYWRICWRNTFHTHHRSCTGFLHQATSFKSAFQI